MNPFYILLGIVVNFIWGLAFFVPYYLTNIDPILVVLSRYFFYGLISLAFLFLKNSQWRSLTKLDWQKAMLFAFAGNIGYYLALTLSIHYAGITLSALILGTLPVTMMAFGNMKTKEFPYRRLILPALLILTGIIALKGFQYSEAATQRSITQTLIGSSWAVVALLIWTWFGVANAEYMKKNFMISGHSWSLAIGVCSLIQVIILFPIVLFFNTESVLASLQNPSSLYQLIIGGVILGVVVSWLATGWWNKISRHLPTAFVGQLLVFETIASLLYGYIYNHTFPQPIILVCIMIVLLGIITGIRVMIAAKKQ